MNKFEGNMPFNASANQNRMHNSSSSQFSVEDDLGNDLLLKLVQV